MQPCGTYAAYIRHKRAGEKPCGACLATKRALQMRPDQRQQRLQYALKSRHGLTPEAFAEMCRHGCAICGILEPGGVGGWHIDHDHSLGCCPPKHSCTKCRRGILCTNCNCGLGRFKDDAHRLLMAVDYLNRWRNR